MDIPKSYESLALENIKISHHPPNTPDATAVVVVTLNRPGKFNAFTPSMADSLTRAFQMFHYDSRVRAIVLTGAGKMFCAGSDLSVGFGDGKGRAADFRDMYVRNRGYEDKLMICLQRWTSDTGDASLC